MKKVSFTILTIALMACFTWVSAQVTVPAPSPAATLTQKVGLTDITIEYSRPSVKGRTIFGKLVPYGETWRTGANKNTMLTFDKDVTIGGTEIKSGKYALFTVPNKDNWEIILYTETENWGVPRKWDASKEAVRFSVKAESMPALMETMTIDVNDITAQSCKIWIMWENTAVGFPVQLGTNAQVDASIDRVFNGPTADDYYQAGRFYLSSDQDANKAYEWLRKSNEMDPKFWRLRHESLALAKLGQYKKAIATAERSKEMAEEAGNAQYVKYNEESIAEWKSKM